MDVSIQTRKRIRGTIDIPGDKSISHRALLISSIAEGDSRIANVSTAADVGSTINCIQALGVEVAQKSGSLVVRGRGKKGLRQSQRFLDCGNSGTTMRLLAGILGGQEFGSELRGDQSLSQRPMKRIIEPLRLMGVDIKGSDTFTAPLRIAPVKAIRPIEYRLPIASAQVKSAVLLAGLFADGITRVIETRPTRDHTERILGLRVRKNGDQRSIEISGDVKVASREYVIPADVSSAAFFVAAALLLQDSEIHIRDVGLNPTRTAFVELLISLGGHIVRENERLESGEPVGDLIVKSSDLRGPMVIPETLVPFVIDEIPILSVMAAVAGIPFHLAGASDLRSKESDRIHSLAVNLRTMGVEVEERADGLSFGNSHNLRGGVMDSFGDHRIAMAFGIAGLKIPGVVIRGAECVDISFPDFWKKLSPVSSG